MPCGLRVKLWPPSVIVIGVAVSVSVAATRDVAAAVIDRRERPEVDRTRICAASHE